MGGWGYLRGRDRDGEPGPDRRQYTFYLFGADSLANSKWWSLARRDLDRGHDLICYVGIEASADAVVVARRRDRDPRALRARGARQGLDRAAPARPPGLVDQPVRHQEFGAMSSGLLVAVFIYWGWDTAVTVNEETEDSTETPGRAAVVTPSWCCDLRGRLGGGTGLPWRRLPLEQLRRRARRARRRARLAVGQAADHRRAHLGVGLDADDDPAHDADVALDGGHGALPSVRKHPPPLPHARRPRSGWAALDRRLRAAQHGVEQHPGRLGRRDRVRDRLLLRADRARVPLVLPP